MDEGMSGFRIKAGGDGGNGGEGGVEGTKCGRWNPTEEQVKVLTDLFMSGLRTPSTDQIQRISSQLSFYGKIESKNIFYWFQNHKARERQKRRRVSVEKRDPFDRVDKVFPGKHFKEVEQISEPERAIKTLQLFPVNSNEESESEKLRFFRNEYKDQMTAFSCAFGKEIDHPQLDLRLSFL